MLDQGRVRPTKIWKPQNFPGIGVGPIYSGNNLWENFRQPVFRFIHGHMKFIYLVIAYRLHDIGLHVGYRL